MRTLLGTVLLGLFSVLPAEAAVVSDVTSTNPFKERLTDRVPVGGRTLVGVVATRTAALPEGKGLIGGTLQLGGGVAGPVCVRAHSEDGLYDAENTFDPAPTPGRVHALGWSDKHIERLQQFPLGELAALTTMGRCDSNGGAIVPTGVEIDPGTDAQFLQILVNTHGAATWAVLRDPGKVGPALARARCGRLEKGARVAYDARCVISLPTQRVELRIEQEGRDGLSLEVVTRAELVGSAPP